MTISADTVPPGDEELAELPPVEFPTWAPETRTEELAQAIATSGTPTTQQAIDAYALLNPDMPGATASELPLGDGFSATYTLQLIDSVRDALVPDQVSVLDAALAVGSDDVVAATAEPDGDRGADSSSTDSSSAAGFIGPSRAETSSASGSAQARARYARLFSEMFVAWQRYRADLPHRTAYLVMMNRPIDGDGMDAFLADGRAGPCRIRVSSNFWQSTRTDDEIRFYFAHELFHCVQFGWFFGRGLPDWLIEGSADFAAADLLRARFSPSSGVLADTWFSRTNVPLAARSYNAWPLFENLRQAGRDPYPLLQAMFSTGAGTSTDNLLATGQMHNVNFRMAWSSHTLRRPQLDRTWQFDWPGNAASGPHDNSSSFGSRGVGTYPIRGVGGYTQVQGVVIIARPVGIVTVTPVGAPLSTHTGEQTVVSPEGAPLKLCFEADGCRCPEGTDSGATRMLHRDMIFSFAASADAPNAQVQAKRWDPKKECREKQPERASSNGDPHLVTFDGLPYDVMTLGEFVTARDPAGGFEVQARHVPMAVGAAGTSAVALGAGDHRVTFTFDELDSTATAVVRVDGTETIETSFDAGEIHVEVDEDDAVATWTDGTRVELHWTAGWFITVTASAERAPRLVGLLGSADGDFRNDLLMPDGTVVDPADAAGAESPFALAWAVDDANSLFDYGPGESPETFLVPPGEAEPFEISAAARDECAVSLGEQAASHEVDACAFDYSVTGNDGFVVAYEDVVDDRVEAITGVVVVEAEAPDIGAVTDALPSLTLSGTLLALGAPDLVAGDAVVRLEGTISAGEGAVLLARVELCPPDVTIWVNVTNVATGASWPAVACDPMGFAGAQADEDDEVIAGETYVWLSEGGDYNIAVETDAEEAWFVSVELFADQSPVVVAASELGDGHRTTIAGAADTVVYMLGLDELAFTATGLDEVCIVEAWGAPEPGDGAVWPLGYCGHQADVALGYAYAPVPVVVFGRQPGAVDVELTPTG